MIVTIDTLREPPLVSGPAGSWLADIVRSALTSVVEPGGIRS
jgi:hypothetical protein